MILIGIGGGLALLAALAAVRRADYHVERRVDIAAPASRVFVELNDLRRFAGVLVFFRSRWEERDPDMERTFEGPAAGVGQSYSWRGDGEVGRGSLTIEESVADEAVRTRLELQAPMKGSVVSTLRVAGTATGSSVTWSMDGRHNFPGRALGIFVNMDGMLGRDIEMGLALLKARVEGGPAVGDVDAAARSGGASGRG